MLIASFTTAMAADDFVGKLENVEDIIFTQSTENPELRGAGRRRTKQLCPISACVDKDGMDVYVNFAYVMDDVNISILRDGLFVISDNDTSDKTSFIYNISEYASGEYQLIITSGEDVWTGEFVID